MCKLGSEELYPLKFVVLAKEKVWGGFKLAQMLEQGVPAEHPVGEVWLVWDRLAVEHGPLAGRPQRAQYRGKRPSSRGASSLSTTKRRAG